MSPYVLVHGSTPNLEGGQKHDLNQKDRSVFGLAAGGAVDGGAFWNEDRPEPVQQEFRPKTCVEVQQATVRNLRPVMGTLLPAAVVANLAVLGLSAREGRTPAFVLTLIGFLSKLAALVLTGIFELPINARVLTWSPEDPPKGWESSRDRWEAVHTARTAISVVGLGCLMAAVLVPPTRCDNEAG